MLRGVLEAQAPPRQTATETIDKYGDRLANATLLDDRRSAIQGLRSLAKQYPASVASKSLRDLISTLTRDSDDVDTAQIVLETLLALFTPSENSPEASDEISLWLADEFSQRQDNTTALLNYLEKGDFYTTLYALQLLSAISSARPERTQECVLSAPLGTARLVGILDDPREAIRSGLRRHDICRKLRSTALTLFLAGLLLLNDVTRSSPELQKLVAFENAFERIFNLMHAEGSVVYGGIVVQDCLSLLANLLQFNASNQTLFRETGLVPRLEELLTRREADDEGADNDAPAQNPTRDRNLWGVLALLRMFVMEGSKGTPASQMAFEKHGVLHAVLLLGFDTSVSLPVRAEALRTCGDMVRGNSTIQERFGHNEVPWNPTMEANRKTNDQANGVVKAHIVDALLTIVLTASPGSMFDVRYAACECLEAYFYNHNTIRLHFLGHAIHLHSQGENESSNILSILIQGPQGYDSSDPYRLWFAAVLTFRLIHEAIEAKSRLMGVTEGDATNGEEVVSCIQVVTGNLMTALEAGEDERICSAYLMLLCGWMFDDADAVNDLLGEGSSVHSLIQAAGKDAKTGEITQGLCAFLLGTLYEFSTKDSPVPRRRLQDILLSKLERDQYVRQLSRLRMSRSVRDFEVAPQDLSSAETPGAQPEVYFDSKFVEFLKDNFSRLTRAIDRDPNLELGGPDKAVDRNLMDDVRRLEADIQDHVARQKRAQEREAELDVELRDHTHRLKKAHDKESELQEELRKQRVNLENAQKAQEDTRKLLQEQEQGLKAAQARESELQAKLKDQQSRVKKVQEHSTDLESTVRALKEKMEAAKQTQADLRSANQEHSASLEKARETERNLQASVKDRAARLKDAQQTHTEYEATIHDRDNRLKEAKDKHASLEATIKKKEEARQAAQTELDDMLIVLGELEEKRAKDKKKLKELGASTSEDEDEDENADEDEDEDENADEDEDEESEKTGDDDID